LGGLTPSFGLLREVLAAVTIPVVVMIRPRPGGFCYSNPSWTVALRDAEAALDAGAAGVVFGVLDRERQVDARRTAQMVKVAGGREVVFHRAFDLTQTWTEALDTLAELQVTRILSSGQQLTAIQGATCLQSMIQRAGERLQVIAGSGVRSTVVPPLLAVGVRQFHGTFSRLMSDPGYGGLPFRFADNDQLRVLDPEELGRMVGLLRG